MYNKYNNNSQDEYKKAMSEYKYICMIVGSSYMFDKCIWLQLNLGLAIKNISDTKQ